MNPLRDSRLGDFTRGGQTTFHFIRMIAQVIWEFFGWWTACFAIIAGCVFWYLTTIGELNVFQDYVLCELNLLAYSEPSKPWPFVAPDGIKRMVTVGWMTTHPAILQIRDAVLFDLGIAVGTSLIFCIIFTIITLRWLLKIGRSQADDRFIRGGMLVDSDELTEQVKEFAKRETDKKMSPITIGKIPIPDRMELTSFLISGGVGSGKSQTILEMLDGMRKAGKRAVICDGVGDYVERFYRPGKDVIINPFDARSVKWDMWLDCQFDYDYASIAEGFIEEEAGKKGDFFSKAARLVLASVMQKMGEQGDHRPTALADKLMSVTTSEIIEIVKGTDAASVINEEGGRMTASVRGVAAASARSLRYMQDEGEPFSLSEFINSDDDRWVFITSTNRQMAVMRPLISTIVHVISTNILSLRPDRNRRIGLFLDELPALQRLPALMDFLSQARKYGGFAALGYQSYSQLVSVYGQHDADTLMDLCATFITYRMPGEKGAEFASKNLLESENYETKEGTSYGVSQIRDGVSINSDRQSRRLVSKTEIMNLPDREGFIRLGRGLPVAKIKVDVCRLPVVAEPFELKPIEELKKSSLRDDQVPVDSEDKPQDQSDSSRFVPDLFMDDQDRELGSNEGAKGDEKPHPRPSGIDIEL